jgi:hypothetical protein
MAGPPECQLPADLVEVLARSLARAVVAAIRQEDPHRPPRQAKPQRSATPEPEADEVPF